MCMLWFFWKKDLVFTITTEKDVSCYVRGVKNKEKKTNKPKK